MKKIVAVMLCMAMLLGCAAALAEAKEYTNIGTISIFREYEARCLLPDGYTMTSVNLDNGGLMRVITNEDKAKPGIVLSIMFDDMYADVKKLNDLDDEQLAFLESTYTDEFEVEISYTETGHGTKLLVAKEVNGVFFDVYTIYEGYEFEIVLVPGEEGDALTEEQIQMAVEFLTNLEFVAVE